MSVEFRVKHLLGEISGMNLTPEVSLIEVSAGTVNSKDTVPFFTIYCLGIKSRSTLWSTDNTTKVFQLPLVHSEADLFLSSRRRFYCWIEPPTVGYVS